MSGLPIRGRFRNFLLKCSAWGALAGVIGFGAPAGKLQAQQDAVPSDSGLSVEASQQIFATMCALYASGFGKDESTIEEVPERVALREDLLKMQGPATTAMRQFYRDHVLGSPTETLSPFMTYAMIAHGPPNFQLEGERETLPPSVLTIDGFQQLLADFYKEAKLGARWVKIEPEAEPLIASYRVVLRRVATVSDAYLREIPKPAYGRSFTVYVEPLVGARTNFRSTGDRYAIVVGSLSDSAVNLIQHAYLHYLLDPFVLKYRPVVYTKRALLGVAARAPQLPEEYHDDFISLTDECLIKAVELRLRHLSGDRLEAELKNADASGFILVRPLVAQLQKFEKDAPAMSYYFPGLITGIDVQAEQARLQNFTFASADAGPAPSEHVGAGETKQASEVDTLLAEGNREIARRDAAAATATFEGALAKYPNDPRVVYGLAIASVLSGKGDRARDLFEQLVSAKNSTADPSVLAWSHVYLGRIHDLEDDRDLAVSEYKAALSVDGAPEAARVAAQSGVESAYKPPSHAGENEQPQP